MYYFLDERGNPEPCDTDNLAGWSGWFETSADERRIAFDDIAPDVRVSTVFLGIDHSFGGERPILFETMIFGGDLDGQQWRYATRAEAVRGHRKAVIAARTALLTLAECAHCKTRRAADLPNCPNCGSAERKEP